MSSTQLESGPILSFNPLDSIGASPSLADDDELWEVFIKLALEHRSKTSKSLDATLDALLLFAALFSAVNVGIIGISLPTLNYDPVRGSEPRSSTLPSPYALNANEVFSSSLTCSLLAAFFSLVGKQWIWHYSRSFPTAHLENLQTLQSQLEGTLRWHFEGLVEVGLTSLLQLTVILFLVEWIPFLHWQGGTVSHPDNGLALSGAFMLVVMFACALWDPWCPFQTPLTTKLPSALGSVFRFLTKLAVTPKTIPNALLSALYWLWDVVRRPSVLLPIRVFPRPDEAPEGTNVKSLLWMLEHAPRGPPLGLVARQVARVIVSSESANYQDVVRRSPHIRRLHETFWDTARRAVQRGDIRELLANGLIDVSDITNVGRGIVATSCRWPTLSIKEVMRDSFNEYAALAQSKLSWEDFSPFLQHFVTAHD